MMRLAEEHGVEACISKTPSYEYWDEMPSKTKIDSMAEYLKDVRYTGGNITAHILIYQLVQSTSESRVT